MAHLVDMGVRLKTEGLESATDYMTKTMSQQKGRSASVTVLRPDITKYPGSPFTGGGLPGPWATQIKEPGWRRRVALLVPREAA
jgi:hypothetical protein